MFSFIVPSMSCVGDRLIGYTIDGGLEGGWD